MKEPTVQLTVRIPVKEWDNAKDAIKLTHELCTVGNRTRGEPITDNYIVCFAIRCAADRLMRELKRDFDV